MPWPTTIPSACAREGAAVHDTAIKNFCIWARRELMAQVALQARRFGIREDGYDAAGADAVEAAP